MNAKKITSDHLGYTRPYEDWHSRNGKLQYLSVCKVWTNGMNYSQKLLTELKATECLPSNYMAAKILQVSESTIYNIDKQSKQFNEENIRKLAELLNIDPHEAVLNLRIETSNPESRKTWEEILTVYQIAQAHAQQGLQADVVDQEQAITA